MAEISLRNTFSTSLLQGIGQLRDEGQLFDMCVVVHGVTFSCHRLILASVSTFFKAKLASSSTDRQIVVDHENVTPESFGLLMDVIYKSEGLITQETAKDLVKMCLYLQIDFMTKYCEDFLSKNLSPEVCIGVWQFAHDYKLTDLEAKSYKMASEDIDKVPSNELVALPKSMLLILLSLQKKLSMDDVCKIILSWVDADKEARAVRLPELLPFVSFPRMTPGYLSDLIMYHNHKLRDILLENVSEGLSFHLKGLSGKDQKLQRQILAKQSIPELKSDLVTPRAVVIGGSFKDGKPIKKMYAFEAGTNKKSSALAPVPSNMGLHFASCTWRNEIYLSGGHLLPNFFAVYKPGGNEWEVLPEIPGEGRCKHAMASVSSNVYVLGGFGQWGFFETLPLEVLKYDIKSQKWREVCKLPSDVEEASAAVLGHRIYLFGGSEYRGEESDLVQCVDTLSKVAYIAGRLPSPSCGSRALSNGGIIWVLLPTGEVLQMHENFELAEQREKILAAGTQPINEGPTVRFTKVMNFTPRCHFGASFLRDKLQIILCGGQSPSGDLLLTAHIRNLASDMLELADQSVLIAGTAHLDLHILNIPKLHLKEARTKPPEASNVRESTPTILDFEASAPIRYSQSVTTSS